MSRLQGRSSSWTTGQAHCLPANHHVHLEEKSPHRWEDWKIHLKSKVWKVQGSSGLFSWKGAIYQMDYKWWIMFKRRCLKMLLVWCLQNRIKYNYLKQQPHMHSRAVKCSNCWVWPDHALSAPTTPHQGGRVYQTRLTEFNFFPEWWRRVLSENASYATQKWWGKVWKSISRRCTASSKKTPSNLFFRSVVLLSTFTKFNFN